MGKAMKILLMGEYSNVHSTLAKALRQLGHHVVVASDGDGWKDYPRDIDLKRQSLNKCYSVGYLWRLLRLQKQFRGFDIVQLINPVFLPLRSEHLSFFYNQLRKHNKKIVMGAYGMDHYYIKACLDFTTFAYSDFAIGKSQRYSRENETFIRDWLNGPKGKLNRLVAQDVDAIVSGLYEYHAAYQAHCPWSNKECFIPFPIELSPVDGSTEEVSADRLENSTQNSSIDAVRFLVGVQRSRAVYKGTDIMLRVLRRVEDELKDMCQVTVVENVPFEKYVRLMGHHDVIVDQLYSYTPAMNALEAMARGLVAVTGGEPVSYDLLGEQVLRPIINVVPTDEEGMYQLFHRLVTERQTLLPKLKEQSVKYIARHHDAIKVARQYETLYRSLLN